MSSSVARHLTGVYPPVGESGGEKSASRDERSLGKSTSGEVADEELMSRLQKGDLEGLSQLYRRYARLVLSICLRILRDTAEAEDLVQDIFLRIHRKSRLFDPSKGSARSWLLQVAYHQVFNRRDYLRARSYYSRAALEDPGTEFAASTLTHNQDVDDLVCWGASLDRAFEELSKEQYLTLKLYYFEGYTVQEISAKMCHSQGNVRNHLYRGLERLRHVLFNGEFRRSRNHCSVLTS